MTEPFNTLAQAIEAIGPTSLGKELGGLTVSTVSSWKQRGSIPSEYWVDFVRVATSRGYDCVTFEWLAKLHAISKGKRSDVVVADMRAAS